MLELLSKIPWHFYAAVVVMVVVWWYGTIRYEDGLEAAEEQYKIEEANAALIAEHEKRILEAEYVKRAATLIEEKRKSEAALRSTIADWQSGKLRLKTRFIQDSCPSSGGDGEAERGLLDEDVQFLIREATRADAIVRQLTACQGLIKDDQATSQ